MWPSRGRLWAARMRGCELVGPGPIRRRAGTYRAWWKEVSWEVMSVDDGDTVGHGQPGADGLPTPPWSQRRPKPRIAF
jgi:hypothetical protein